MILAACASQKNAVMVVSLPYPSGQRHTEPVFYNGQYEVSFTFNAIANAYDMMVSGTAPAARQHARRPQWWRRSPGSAISPAPPPEGPHRR